MVDVYEKYGVIEPMKKGDIEGLLEVLKSDKDISREIRNAIIDLLEKNPPKKPKGRPAEDKSPVLEARIIELFLKYHKGEKLSVYDSLEKMAPITAMSVGTLRALIYSDFGQSLLKTISKKSHGL